MTARLVAIVALALAGCGNTDLVPVRTESPAPPTVTATVTDGSLETSRIAAAAALDGFAAALRRVQDGSLQAAELAAARRRFETAVASLPDGALRAIVEAMRAVEEAAAAGDETAFAEAARAFAEAAAAL